MKIIGMFGEGSMTSHQAPPIMVQVSADEWERLCQIAGKPYEKWKPSLGAEVSVKIIQEAISAFAQIKDMRKSIGIEMQRLEKIAAAIDQVVTDAK